MAKLKALKKFVHKRVREGEFPTTVDCYQWIATQLGLRCHSSVRQWAAGTREVNPKYAKDLEKITGIPKHVSCPSIFDAP